MIFKTLLVSGVLAAAAPSPFNERSSTVSEDTSNPIIDLGPAGSYKGILQNNDTVASWKGIPYAQPPVGNLRFMPPEDLTAQDSNVVDTTTDALRCVQFSGDQYGVINSNIVGARSGPGQEDCLKLWIWKPANASSDASLPVMFYIHGGGLQYSAAPNNDFSDWVGQSQDFIAVNVAYRLGALGFMAHPDLPSANAGLLDQRLALQWIKKNIGAFGGNPEDVTIMGQSGGGYAVVSQMALYEGDSQGLFHKAIPRSIQRSPSLRVDELADRNAQFFKTLNCTSVIDQLDCFRNASVPALVNAYAEITKHKASTGSFANLTFGSSAAFLPMIDDVTLTDSITHLFKQGKVANVPVLAGYVNDEGANSVTRNTTRLSPATSQVWNFTAGQVEQAASYYPVNGTFGFASPDNFFLSPFKAYMQSLHPFGEGGISGSERVVGKYVSEAFGSDRVWTFRFNAPTVGTNYSSIAYPLNYVAHSADNSYLQNATAIMTPFERAIAHEWRAYIGSFIRTGDPNPQKLGSSPKWPSYGALGDFVNSPVRLVPQFRYSSNANTSYETSTQVEVAQKAQLEREDWWTSDEILEATRV